MNREGDAAKADATPALPGDGPLLVVSSLTTAEGRGGHQCLISAVVID